MFLLNGDRLNLHTPFEHEGIRYPANWLQFASLEEKEAIGITEVEDDPIFDARFYRGYDSDGNLIPFDHQVLAERYIAVTKKLAHDMLQQTDWMVIREMDTGEQVSAEVSSERQRIRDLCGIKIETIEDTTNTDELAEVVTSFEFNRW